MQNKTIKQVLFERSNDYTFLEKEYAKNTNSSLTLNPYETPPSSFSGKPLTVSVVLPAYNVSSSILACLLSIEQSSFNIHHQNRLQVIVVDDGSIDGTWEIIKKTQFSLHLILIRQANHGQAQALNTGISVAEGDIIISCDADMVLSYYTIEHFVARHQQFPNVLLAGFRSNTNPNDFRVDPQFIRKQGSHRKSIFTNDERLIFPTIGWPNNMSLASKHFKQLGNGRRLWMPDGGTWLLPDLVIGALFSLSKNVFFNIGGYDERLSGWGCTDGYLAAKAISAGQYIVPVYAASGLHINHPPRSETKHIEFKHNRELFFRFIRSTNIDNHPNWLKHAKNRILESYVCNPSSTFDMLNNHSQTMEDINNLEDIDALLAIGKYSKVIKNININHSDGELLLRLGKAFLGSNQYKKAINAFENASALFKFPSEAKINLAIAYAANGQFSLSREVLKKLSETHPKTPDLRYWFQSSAQKHIRQGVKYFVQEFYFIASRCFEAALIIEPNNKIAMKYREQCSSAFSDQF